jgi:hypothetical protein
MTTQELVQDVKNVFECSDDMAFIGIAMAELTNYTITKQNSYHINMVIGLDEWSYSGDTLVEVLAMALFRLNLG